jgi:hypothetical protein
MRHSTCCCASRGFLPAPPLVAGCS